MSENLKEKTKKDYETENDIRNMNIYEKLSNICNELSAVAKNLEVGVGQSKYNAVGEADVLAAVKPLEYKYRIYSYPFSRRVIESSIIENEGIDHKTKEKVIKKNLFERIETIYRFVNIDNDNQYIDITTYGDGIDSQDKSVGKAMTYADKYALLKAYKIITGEDPDQNASEDLKGKKETPKFEEKPNEIKLITLEQKQKLQELSAQNPNTDIYTWLIKKCQVETIDQVPSVAVDNLFKALKEKKEKQNDSN